MPKQSRYLIDKRWFTTSEVRSLIVQALPDLKPGRVADQLHARFGSSELSQPTISKMLLAMTRQGKIVRTAHGRYTRKDPT